MRRSVLLVVVAALAALALSAGTTAAAAAPRVLVVRIVDPPNELEPLPAECTAGGAVAQLRSPRGAIVGSVENCIHRSDFSCTEAGCTQVEDALQTFRLPGGTILVRARLTFRISDDFASAIHVIVGSVVGGSGVYAGASGALIGGGPVRFAPEGPQPAFTEVLILR